MAFIDEGRLVAKNCEEKTLSIMNIKKVPPPLQHADESGGNLLEVFAAPLDAPVYDFKCQLNAACARFREK